MKEEVILQVVAKTSVGRVREMNEDNFIVTNNIGGTDWFLPAEAYPNGPTGTVMVIADGMGGTNAGEVASQIAVESVKKYFNALSSSPLKPGKTGAILRDSILYAHKAIVNHSSAHRETEGMGTTLVLCWILGGRAYVGWSGDSRCYAWHPARGLRQLSKDHSYVQSLVDEGKITEADAFDHPQNNIVLQSLGDGAIGPEPDVTNTWVEKDDMLLVCSDGLSGMLKDAEIAETLQTAQGDVGAAVNRLIDQANEAGGTDNITVILARVIDNTVPEETPGEEKEDWGRTARGRTKKGRGRMLSIAGLAVIAVGLAAYSYIHSLKGPASPPVQTRHDSGGLRHRPNPAKDDGTGDPSAAKGGQTPDEEEGDRHPKTDTSAIKNPDTGRHSHAAREVVTPGAPVPGAGAGKPAGEAKKDSVRKDSVRKDSVKREHKNPRTI